ncbi:MAG TPA: hypothetical protein VF587_04500, partial [Solirubrobacteraceae bacterium]
ASALAAAGTNTLSSNETLYAGQYLTADYGRYNLWMQGDGNLVLYGEEGKVLWSSGTYGSGANRAVMQLDGNFVLYSNSGPVWATNTYSGGSRLQLKSDGNLQVVTTAGGVAWQTGVSIAASDTWNPRDFKKVAHCARLVSTSAYARYTNSTSPGTDYEWRNSQAFESDHCNQTYPLWVDAQERITTLTDPVRYLYFVHGGPGRVPYGHIRSIDIQNQPTNAYSTTPENGSQGAGRGCSPGAGDPSYTIKIDPLGTADAVPDSWQYKIGETNAKYHKYQSAGELQGNLVPGPAKYGYLTWVWVMRTNRSDTPVDNNPWTSPDAWGNERATNPSGGIVRALMRDGQEFQKCGNVESINSLAWAPGATSTDPPVGRLTVIYGRTRPSVTSPWLYGWAVFSHECRARSNPDGSPVWGRFNDVTKVCTEGGRNLHVY